jgi:predicted metal-dependent enzyme (double-stranded beta helix superfamily)
VEIDGTLRAFVDEVDVLVGTTDDEHEITTLVADRLSALLAGGYRLPDVVTRPSAERHVNYPLHIAPGHGWCLAAVVWSPGQRTPVHGHETWGVVGIHSGAEREFRYAKPTAAEEGRPLTPLRDQVWSRGAVTVCCTTDDDVHAVAAVGDEPTVGIHVYGADIGVLERRRYDPATGAVQWFVSGWDTPPGR